jgi:hypothetical protein
VIVKDLITGQEYFQRLNYFLNEDGSFGNISLENIAKNILDF